MRKDSWRMVVLILGCHLSFEGGKKFPSHTPDQLNPFLGDRSWVWLKSPADSQVQPVLRTAPGCCQLWPLVRSDTESQLVVKSRWTLRKAFCPPPHHYPAKSECAEEETPVHIPWITVMGILLFWQFGWDLFIPVLSWRRDFDTLSARTKLWGKFNTGDKTNV